MAKKKRVAKNQGWRSPIEGWPFATNSREARGRVLRLRLDGTPRSVDLAMNLAPLIGSIHDLLGDHEVQILAGELRGAAWLSDLPWRQIRHGFSLKLPIAQLRHASIADQVAEHAVRPPVFNAQRGRGETRTLVWMLSGGQLDLATKFIHANDYPLLQTLAHQLFDIGSSTTVARGGHGELADDSTDMRLPPTRTGWSFESWLADAVERRADDTDPPLLAGPRWITLLTWRHLARMGGIERVEAGEREVERVCARGRRAPGWNNFPGPFLRTQPVRHGLVVTLAPIKYVFDEECLDPQSGWGHNDALAGARWFMHELHRNALLALPTDDWLPRLAASIDRSIADNSERTEQQRLRAAQEPDHAARPPRMHAPRCIQGVGKPEPSSRAASGHEAEVGSFRIFRGDLSGEEGLPIYGRKGPDSCTLVSPVLVGAMKADRAALFFDARLHGWEAELAPEAPARSRPLGGLTQLICPQCDGRFFHAWASFERNDEQVASAELKPGRTEDDLFTWFTLDVQCAACTWRHTVVSVECA